MQRGQYRRRTARWTLRRGAWVRLLLAGLAGGVLFMLAARLLLPGKSPAAEGVARPNAAVAGPAVGTKGAAAQAAAPTPAPEASAFAELTRQQVDQAGALVLVNQTHGWPQGYEPPLITMAQRRPRDLMGLKSTEMRADATAFDALVQMLQAAKEDGVTGFLIVSSYRGYDKQKELFDARVQELMQQGMELEPAQDRADDTVARPGRSEHQTGLAFDIVAQSGDGTLEAFHQSSQCLWITQHCSDYGFVLRYPEDKTDITGIDNEPWHYRYVGVEHAQAMARQNMCLEEYVAHLQDRSLSGSAP